MTLIDADKFLGYLIFSKHIDSLTCHEVKEAVEMCRVDVFEQMQAEILNFKENCNASDYLGCGILDIINKYADSITHTET